MVERGSRETADVCAKAEIVATSLVSRAEVAAPLRSVRAMEEIAAGEREPAAELSEPQPVGIRHQHVSALEIGLRRSIEIAEPVGERVEGPVGIGQRVAWFVRVVLRCPNAGDE